MGKEVESSEKPVERSIEERIIGDITDPVMLLRYQKMEALANNRPSEVGDYISAPINLIVDQERDGVGKELVIPMPHGLVVNQRDSY